jgi:hypothetical protein
VARSIPYNRKINAPIRFLYYLEIVDLFFLLILGVLAPLFVSSFMPVSIPLWHSAIWFMSLFFFLVLIKVGRAPGFVPHWLGKTFRGKSFHPGKKSVEYFIIADKPLRPAKGAAIFTPAELREIQNSVRKLRQARRESEMMQPNSDLD